MAAMAQHAGGRGPGRGRGLAAKRCGAWVAAALALLAPQSGLLAATAAWPNGGNSQADQRASAETTIMQANAAHLALLWSAKLGGDISATPTIAGGTVYVPDWGGYVWALSLASGAVVWKVKLADLTGNPASFSRNSPAVGANVIVLGDQAAGALLGLDRASGKLLWRSLLDANATARITASPVIFQNVVYAGVSSLEEGKTATPGYVASFRGSVVALDPATGRVKWQSYTVPPGYTGGAVWGTTPAIDAVHHRVYVGTGNNYTLPQAAAACLTAGGSADACLDAADFADSVLALDSRSGARVWGRRLGGADGWSIACSLKLASCNWPAGPDYDVGSGINLYTAAPAGRLGAHRIAGVGQKSGIYWALDPDSGAVLWQTQVGPGGKAGGIQWGTAVDAAQVYVPVSNSGRSSFTLPGGLATTGGAWAALNNRTGKIIWQIAASGTDPGGLPARAFAPPLVVNGVVFFGSTSGDLVALNAATGAQIFRFTAQGSVFSAPAIAGGVVVFGSGYAHFSLGTAGGTLYALGVK